jgi:hypothetical protein
MTLPRLLLALSLLGNLALWGAWRWMENYAVLPADVAPAISRPADGHRVPDYATPPGQAAGDPERAAAVGGSTWDELRSDDLRQFVERLRAAGFPPHVVRALVVNAANRQFAAQREQLLAGGADEVPFWKQPPNAFQDPEIFAAYQKLSRERENLLQELLGPDAAAGDELTRAYQQRRFGELAPEKLQRLQALLADYNELRAQLRPAGRPAGPEDAQRAAGLEQELRADLARLLTPSELEQYDLRSSPTAAQLRRRLDAFRPSEDEYKAIFSMQRMLDAQNPALNQPPNPQQLAARQAAEEQVQTQLQSVLGPDRYADYLQATNPSHAALNQLVARLDLPVAAAREVVAVQQSIGGRARGILTSDTLTPQQQREQLQALSREATARISATLGPRGLDAYQKQAQWMKALTRPVGPDG